MQSKDSRLRVLEHELLTIRAIRIGPDLDMAVAAVQRERELLETMAQRERELSIHDVVPADGSEFESAVNFSLRGKGTKPEAGTGTNPEA